MDTSLDSASDVLSTNRILYGAGAGMGGYGYGQGLQVGNSVLAANAHADGTGTGNNVRNLAELTRFGFDSNQEQIRETRTIDQFNGIRDNQFRAELRGSDQVSALARDVANNAREMDKTCCTLQQSIADAAKDAAQCCCDAKLEACKNTAELKALVISENSATRELIRGDALAAANAKITQLETINALSSRKISA